MQQVIWTDFWRKVDGPGTLRVTPVNEKRCCLPNVFLLLEVPDLKFVQCIDISGCVSLDVTSFIDICELFECLEYFIFRGCKQISQYNLMRVCELCNRLKYIDGKGASTVSATIAIGIIYNLPSLLKFECMPKPDEIGQWQFIVFQYSRIIFGQSIRDEINDFQGIRTIVNLALKNLHEQ